MNIKIITRYNYSTIAVIIILFVMLSGCNTLRDSMTPEEAAEKVADHLVLETKFGFVPVISSDMQEGAYYIDFFDSFGTDEGAIYYARASIGKNSTAQSENILLGISHSPGDILIRLNNKEIYRNRSETTVLSRSKTVLISLP
jgi:hypothetical protein